ncbi:hypothetical protein B0H34DRAFT_486601 [Crassisporium funariophilum]|nr:hypothetical protein B0H34DRAFT_486601 [Crassisporium funariophilum]
MLRQDAYHFPLTDIDEEWSTLPSRKRKKTKLFHSSMSRSRLNLYPRSIVTAFPNLSRPFSLPSFNHTPMMVETDMSVTSGRRIQTYLPPPLAPSLFPKNDLSNHQNEDIKPKVAIKGEVHGGYNHGPSPPYEAGTATSSPLSFDAGAYPSPSTSKGTVSLPETRTRHIRNPVYPRHEVRTSSSYRPLSPPTSDLPQHSDDHGDDVAMDVHIQVNFEGIRRRYPEVKRFVNKVQFSKSL